jgi:hypothetical protein
VEGAAAEEIDDESGRGGRAEEVAEVRIGRARELEDLDLLARQAGGEGDDSQVVYCNDPGKKIPNIRICLLFSFPRLRDIMHHHASITLHVFIESKIILD